MASSNTRSDSGAVFGATYDVTVDGYTYTLKTVDQSLPVNGEQILDATGLFKGGGYVRGQERLQVEIDAITGTPAPSQLVPFALAIHGFTSKNWIIGTLNIRSGNAQLRTYSAEIMEYKAAL
jgi:hypothetical protein